MTKNNNLTILEHNASTGEIIERSMTEAEIAAAIADAQAATEAKSAAELAKENVLSKLGLTAEEAKLLLS
tara:strand:+ start:2094 stop:2303 length:210 start_codon:yes stop_codon:yes gene_type:complete